jgi:hypothetical protein
MQKLKTLVYRLAPVFAVAAFFVSPASWRW